MKQKREKMTDELLLPLKLTQFIIDVGQVVGFTVAFVAMVRVLLYVSVAMLKQFGSVSAEQTKDETEKR